MIQIKQIKDVCTGISQHLETLPQGGVDLIGYDSGYKELNKMTLGLRPDVIILMGRPSMGKTTFSLTLAEAISKQIPVLYFSIEMTAEDVVAKIISARSKLPYDSIMLGKLDSDGWDNLMSGFQSTMDLNIHFVEEASITMPQIRQVCEEFKKKHNEFFVVIDYLQLISVEGKHWSRDDEVSKISKALVQLKKDLKVPVMTLSQMNRECEKRTDPRPMMSDLRESGSIEQDADIIMGIYRPARLRLKEDFDGQTFIDVLKNRKGRVGDFQLQFLEEEQRFIQKESIDF